MYLGVLITCYISKLNAKKYYFNRKCHCTILFSPQITLVQCVGQQFPFVVHYHGTLIFTEYYLIYMADLLLHENWLL